MRAGRVGVTGGGTEEEETVGFLLELLSRLLPAVCKAAARLPCGALTALTICWQTLRVKRLKTVRRKTKTSKIQKAHEDTVLL